MARIAYGLYRGGFLNAVSVGFIPLRWENGTEQTAYGRKYLEQELLEVSAVGIRQILKLCSSAPEDRRPARDGQPVAAERPSQTRRRRGSAASTSARRSATLPVS